jgi:quercetin dioxygenase-like cupin family protein
MPGVELKVGGPQQGLINAPRLCQISSSTGGDHFGGPEEGGYFTMTTTYTHFLDLAKEVQPPEKGILSRTLLNDDRLKVILFGFGQGEELSEHTASMPAVLHFLQGEAGLTLDDDPFDAKAGTWVHMPKGMRHSILARTQVVMLLMLLK